MLIYNLKVNGSKLYKLILFIIISFVIILCGIVSYKVYKSTVKVNDEISSPEIVELTTKNYSTILKVVHEDIDAYIGKRFKFSGFVHRVYDLSNDQFILARNMIISSDNQTVIVGFLCRHDDAINLKNDTWVEIEGTIIKGEYHGDMPILQINNLREIDKPKDEYVYPPDKDYIPTSVIL